MLLPTLVLALLVALGYAAGTYVSGRKIANLADAYEKSETLAGVLAVTPLSERQKNDITKAYSHPDVDRASVSWAVPNQPTPFVGTAPRPGKHQNATINAWQMRSQSDVAIPKPSGVYRIFLTGGSTAYGSGAPSQDTTVGALLEAKLNVLNAGGAGAGDKLRFEVFTFANPAWSTTQERIAIENYLSELEPDLIVSLSGNNDVFWGDAGRNVLWYSTFSDDYFNAVANAALGMAGRTPPAPLPHAGPISGKVNPEQVAARLKKNVVLGATALNQGGVKADWIYFLQPNLAATKKALSARESEFLTSSRDYYIQSYARIGKALRALQLPNFAFVDLSSLFDARGKGDEVFLDQFHFGDIGNEAIATAMAREVARRLP